jgi:hypothetical protein
MHSTTFGSPETRIGTSPALVGRLVLRAETTVTEENGVRTDATDVDPAPKRPQDGEHLVRYQNRPSSTTVQGYFDDALRPPIPVTSSRPSSRTTSRVPSRPRLPSRRIETRSLPLIAPPLSAGPSAYEYMPVSERPEGFEGLGPFEHFPRAPNRTSLVGAVMTLCVSDAAVERRLSSHVFAYTPGAEHSITRVKKKTWWKKGMNKVKKLIVGRAKK